MRGKKVLIFGAAGFIGTYLIEELIKRKVQVVASDISKIGEDYYRAKGVEYVHVDITKKKDFDKIPKYSYHAVIHLAATQPANVSVHDYDPVKYIQVNVIGTLNILNFCRQLNTDKVIYATSHRNTQGLWKLNKAITEDAGRSILYSGDYAMFSISESAAQDCVLHYNEEYGLKGIIFRLPPVYGFGPHMEIFKDGKPIKTGFQTFIDNAMNGQPLEVWGDCNVGRDIIYIKDVIEAFVLALKPSDVSGLFNITSGKRLTLMEEAKTIAKVFWKGESELPITEKPEKPNNIDNFYYDISKAYEVFNWQPQYSFEEMLHDFIRESDEQKYAFLIEKRNLLFENNGKNEIY